MTNSTTAPGTPSSRARLFALGLALVCVGWWGSYLLQPASLPLVDAGGKPVDRLTELLVMPMTLDGIGGDGRQALGVLDKLPLLTAALAWLGLAWWLGRTLVERTLPEESRLVRHSVAILAGLAWLSSLTLLVGLFPHGLGSRWPLLAALIVCAIAAWRFPSGTAVTPPIGKSQSPREPAREEALQPADALGQWMLRLVPVLVGSLAVLYVLAGGLPAWEFDVLEYHLQAPKEFHQAGQVQFIEHNVYANMPLGAEMHSLAWMTLLGGPLGWWVGGLIGKLIIASISLTIAAAVGGFIGRRYGANCGWCAAGLMLGTAGCVHVSTLGLVDMVLGAYIAATCLVWGATRSNGTGVAARALLLGLFVGAAAASKYTGVLFAVLPVAVCLTYETWRDNRERLGVVLGAFGVALAVTGLPWFAKNAAVTGNPVYPLAANVFDTPGLSADQLARWQRVHQPQASEGQSPFGLEAWWRSASRLLWESPFVHPSLLLLASVGLLAQRRTPPLRFTKGWVTACALGVAWILLVWWLGTHRIDRFWVPILPLLALLAGYGVAVLGTLKLTKLAGGIALWGIAYGALQAFSGAAQVDRRILVALHELEQEHVGETADGYLTPIAWINAHLGPDDRVLCIGEAKAYDFRVPIVYATCFNTNPGESWLAATEATQQRKHLADQGISHVFVNWSEIARYRSPGNYGFSPWPQPADVELMERSGVLRRVESLPFEAEAVALYEVLAADAL